MRTIAAASGLMLGLGLAGTAIGADWRGPHGQMPPPIVQEFGSGWYLRGDIGWSTFEKAKGELLLAGVAVGDFDRVKVEDTWVLGGGFGYKTGFVRFDVTTDYRARAELKAQDGPAWAAANVLTWSSLLNGYVDLGSWAGFTPYVGAGLGGTYYEVDGWRDALGSSVDEYGGWSFSWALMAGVAWQAGPNVLVDVGYRYIDLGEIESGYRLPIVPPLVKTRLESLDAHEVRVGVRFLID